MILKIISKEELASLIRDQYKLKCLETMGVDKWINYDEALYFPNIYGNLSYIDYRNSSDDELTSEYDDIKINDNKKELYG